MNYSPNYSMPEPGYGDIADIDAVNDAIEMIDHLTHGNRTMFAGGWEAEETYSKGKYVVKTNPTNLEADFYRCKEDNTTGAWDASKWEHKTIGEVLEELASSAGAQELGDLSDVEITNPTEGQILRRNANGDWVNTDMPDASVTKTAEGNPVEITDGASAPLVKCVSAITGSQDLHGYDKPWVGGAGKNIIPMTLSGIRARNVSGTWTGNVYVLNGITFTVLTDNAENVTGIQVNGTASNNTIISFPLFQMQNVLHYGTGGVDVINAYIYGGYNDGSWHPIPSIGNGQKSFTPEANQNYDVGIYIKSGYNAQNIVFYPMIRLATEADSTFAPYSNICPITAYTEGEIEVSDGDGNTTTHTTTFPSAIYRGSDDCVNGRVTTEWGMIASYAGETLPGEWISDQDEYVPGTTPTTGAQVAYALATPTVASVTPTNLPIKSLNGYSHIESTTGDMEIEYIAKAYSPITELVDSQISALQKMMELMLTSAREAEMVASANYTTGTLIVACGALYKATTAISSGASLVVGTNITPTTIAAELAALA